MEPVTIAIICAAAFGVAVALAVFIRHLLLSRDKRLNDMAQHNAIEQEAMKLEDLRSQMMNSNRFDYHQKLLNDNKAAIQLLDEKIEAFFKEKTVLVNRYAKATVEGASAIIDGEYSAQNKEACDKLRENIDEQIKLYDEKLELLQQQRSSLWNEHANLQNLLINEETERNKHLDRVYKHHSGTLEKVYLRHMENSEKINEQAVDSSNKSFEMLVMGPIQFLKQFFGLSTGISTEQMQKEIDLITKVADLEIQINGIAEIKEEKELRDKTPKSRDQRPSELTL